MNGSYSLHHRDNDTFDNDNDDADDDGDRWIRNQSEGGMLAGVVGSLSPSSSSRRHLLLPSFLTNESKEPLGRHHPHNNDDDDDFSFPATLRRASHSTGDLLSQADGGGGGGVSIAGTADRVAQKTVASKAPPSPSLPLPPFSVHTALPPHPSPSKTPSSVITYDFRLITARFTDPQLPEMLRPVIESNESLLRMYESGLPAWASFLPRTGMYYRPWLRSLTWALFYAFSFFSLAVGFYDLYKTLPGLQAVLSRMVAGLWLPPAAVLQWIEEHAQIRLSILLTYIFGKSEMMVYVVRMIGHAKRSFFEAMGPVWAAASPPLIALWQAGIAPAASVLKSSIDFFSAVVVPPLQALYTAFIIPCSYIASIARQLWTAVAGVASTSAVAAEATPWLSRAFPIPVEAVEALRGSLGRSTRAAQSVWRTIMHVLQAVHRHRLTWALRARRWRERTKAKIVAAVYTCFDVVVTCARWTAAILRLIVEAAKAGVVRAAEEERKEIRVAHAKNGTLTHTNERIHFHNKNNESEGEETLMTTMTDEKKEN